MHGQIAVIRILKDDLRYFAFLDFTFLALKYHTAECV